MWLSLFNLGSFGTGSIYQKWFWSPVPIWPNSFGFGQGYWNTVPILGHSSWIRGTFNSSSSKKASFWKGLGKVKGLIWSSLVSWQILFSEVIRAFSRGIRWNGWNPSLDGCYYRWVQLSPFDQKICFPFGLDQLFKSKVFWAQFKVRVQSFGSIAQVYALIFAIKPGPSSGNLWG